MRHSTPRSVAALTVGLLLLTACGDDGDDAAAAEPFVRALSTSLQEPESDGEFALSAAVADCIAEQSVAVIGVSALEAADVTPDELAESEGPQDLDGLDISEEQARELSRAYVDCDVPFGEAFASFFGAPDAADCIDENFDVEAFTEAQAQQFLGNEDDANAGFDEVGQALAEACSLGG